MRVAEHPRCSSYFGTAPNAIEQQVHDAKQGKEHLFGEDLLSALVLLNVFHPSIANWSTVELVLAMTKFHSSRLRRSILTLERHAGKIPPKVRSILRPRLKAIVERQKTPTRAYDFIESVDVREDALVALAALFPGEVTDEELRQQLTCGDPIRRAAAVRVLVSNNNDCRSNLFLLAVCARDPDEVVRKSSVVGLATWVVKGIALPGSRNVLEELLAEGEPGLGSWASQVLKNEYLDWKHAKPLAEMLHAHPSSLVQTIIRMAEERMR